MVGWVTYVPASLRDTLWSRFEFGHRHALRHGGADGMICADGGCGTQIIGGHPPFTNSAQYCGKLAQVAVSSS